MNGKLLPSQAFWLISTSVFTSYALYLPSRILQVAGPDFWVAELLALSACLPFVLVGALAGLRFPDRSFAESVKAVLGKPLAICVNLLFVVSFILLAAAVLRGFVDILITAILPRTPPVVFIVAALATSAFLVIKGITVLGRLGGLAGPIVFALMGATVLLSLREADFSHLLPVLAHGWTPALSTLPPVLAYLAEFGAIIFVIHNLTPPSSAFRIGLGWLFFQGLTSILLTLAIVSVLSVEYAAALTAPFLSLARGIVLGRFLNRIEALVLTVWIFGGIVKLAFVHYLAVSVLAQTFCLKREQVSALPVALLVGALSLEIFPNIFNLIDFLSSVLSWYHPLVFFMFPALVWVVAVIRKQGISSKDTLRTAYLDFKLGLAAFAATVKQAYYSVISPSQFHQP